MSDLFRPNWAKTPQLPSFYFQPPLRGFGFQRKNIMCLKSKLFQKQTRWIQTWHCRLNVRKILDVIWLFNILLSTLLSRWLLGRMIDCCVSSGKPIWPKAKNDIKEIFSWNSGSFLQNVMPYMAWQPYVNTLRVDICVSELGQHCIR